MRGGKVQGSVGLGRRVNYIRGSKEWGSREISVREVGTEGRGRK